MQEELQKSIVTAVQKQFGIIELPDFTVVCSDTPVHGDYATNVAMILARILKKNPMEIAEKLKPEIMVQCKDMVGWVEIVKPGFINIRLKDAVLRDRFADVIKNPEEWGTSNIGDGKTVIVEYFQLNIAKRPHIGHLRSAVIGDALKRILLASGYHAVSDTHVGDWGTQFGILLYAYKQAIKNNPEFEKKVMENPFGTLYDVYVEEHKKIDDMPEERELRKQEFVRLEQGDIENRKIWKWMVEISMKKLLESADRLRLLPFDEHRGESAYEGAMPDIVDLALKSRVARRDEKDAVIVDLIDQGLDEAVLVKSDGASTYLLRDLATIRYRREHWNFWKNVYVVDVGQTHYFRQVFRVAELLGFEGVGASQHIAIGQMKLPEGKLSTRKGNIVYLDAVLDEAISRAHTIIKEKNPELASADDVARMVGIGAVKYFDLAHDRTSNIVFRWEDALAFEGNTGPYIQYTHARLRSILRKGAPSVEIPVEIPLDERERLLMFTTVLFPEIIARAREAWSPHLLAHYLYELAQCANEFYHSHPVLQEEDANKKILRLVLVSGVAATLKRGLYLLGIEAPDEM